jgi:hypothetical protein
MKITEKQLDQITEYLKINVWRNDSLEWYNDDISSLIDVISSLHNLLYECVTGQRYDYAFHWCNKIGTDTLDNLFDDI